MNFHKPTIEEINRARKAFTANEPRDLFYRVATELVNRAIRGSSSLSLAEAVAVLLQTWNKAYYIYRTFDSHHFSDIERLLNRHRRVLLSFRRRSIESFCEEDKKVIRKVFKDFENVLGPVGAAKCLHLLAPRFFPLWDRAVSKAYGLALQKRGKNAERYCHFVLITKEQRKGLGGRRAIRRNPLKAIDEYNYCKYTKRWI